MDPQHWQAVWQMSEPELNWYTRMTASVWGLMQHYNNRGYTPYVQVRREQYPDLLVSDSDYEVFADLPDLNRAAWIYVVLEAEMIVSVNLSEMCSAIESRRFPVSEIAGIGLCYRLPYSMLATEGIRHLVQEAPGLVEELANAHDHGTSILRWEAQQIRLARERFRNGDGSCQMRCVIDGVV